MFQFAYNGQDGQSGQNGQNGHNGHNGQNGQNGHNGQNGQNGQEGQCDWFHSSSVALLWTMKRLRLKLPHESKSQELDIFWNWICYWFNLDRKGTQEPHDFLEGLSNHSDQKSGETIFEFVPGFIDFLKPSTEEKRIKQPCANCGFASTTMIHNVHVSLFEQDLICPW